MTTAARRAIALAVLALAALVARPAEARAQFLREPSPPVGPTSRAVCQQHREAWNALVNQLGAAHQSCLDAHTNEKKQKGFGIGDVCDYESCQSLHTQWFQAQRDRDAAVANCNREADDYLKRKREQEEAERKRKEEAERKRKEEEERKRKDQEEKDRLDRIEKERQDRLEEERRKAQDYPKPDEAGDEARRSAERDAEEQHARDQAKRDEEARAKQAADDRAREEQRARERESEVDKMFRKLMQAAEMARMQQQAFEKRSEQREERLQQNTQESIARGQVASEKQKEQVDAIRQALADLRSAVATATGVAEATSVGDLVGAFDMSSADEGEARDPMAQQIHDLIDETQQEQPWNAVPLEYVRSIFDETYGGMDRLDPIFTALGNLESVESRAADDFVNGYNARVFGPRNTLRILADHQFGDGTTERVERAATRLARIEAAFEARDPLAPFRRTSAWAPGDAASVGWWASEEGATAQLARDARGVPILVGPDGRRIGYDASRNVVTYRPEDIPMLLEQRGARLERTGDGAWSSTGVLFAPYARDGETREDAGRALGGWIVGDVMGRAMRDGGKK